MKHFLFLIATILSYACYGSDGYRYIETTATFNPSAFQIASFTEQFEKVGFYRMTGFSEGVIPELFVDQIYSNGEQYILLKLGLKVSDSNITGKILDHPKGFLYHNKIEGRTDFAVFFYKVSKLQATEIVSKLWNPKKQAHYFINSILPEAHAQEACSQSSSANSIGNSGESMWLKTLGDTAATCALSALKSAKDQAVSMVTDTAKFFKSLFTEPTKLWNEAVEKFEGILNFVDEFKPRMIQFFDGLAGLDREALTEIACSTVSSIVVGALIGGGLAKLAVTMTTRLMAMEKNIGIIKKLGKLKNTKAMKEVISCVP